MSPHSAYVMVSQPSPALPHTLPFISSPDSTNTTPSTSAPVPPTAPPGHRPGRTYYPPSNTNNGDQHSSQSQPQSHPSDVKISLSTSIKIDESADPGSDLDQQQPQQTSRPILETDGVVSAEVGDVPGILHQDLHPDGQPRRPMNAFMIFARHRRPAIQAKEPGLKTGEISKRLSHDWKHLPDEDKTHYLEQAKLLKDEFHNRFPEYVYKRRPNNTGKRRSSTSQQQIHPKFACGPGGSQPMGAPPAQMNGGMPHPAEFHGHHYHQHLHPGHSDIYSQGHHIPHHHHHNQPPPRPLSSIAQPSPEMTSHNFYPSPTNPSSPRYHQIGPPPPSNNIGAVGPRPQPLGSYQSRGPSQPAGTIPTAGPPGTQSSRPGSPGNSPSSMQNGISYMRVSNPHTMNHHTQQSPNHYPWFGNDHPYGPPSGHHPAQPQAPLSANRPSFFYHSSWPTSGTPDSQPISATPSRGGAGPEGSEPTHPGPQSRASYSAGPPLYRPPSPVDRARQLSLPSHSLSNSSGAEPASNGPSDAGSPYANQPHHEHQSGQSVLSGSNGTSYGAYASPDVMSGAQRSPYNGQVATGFGAANGGRNGLVPQTNGQQSNGDLNSNYEHHQQSNHAQNMNSATANTSQQQHQHQQTNDFAAHCSPIHHHPPPQPPPSVTNNHHQHAVGTVGATGAAPTSVAY